MDLDFGDFMLYSEFCCLLMYFDDFVIYIEFFICRIYSRFLIKMDRNFVNGIIDF